MLAHQEQESKIFFSKKTKQEPHGNFSGKILKNQQQKHTAKQFFSKKLKPQQQQQSNYSKKT